MSGGHDLPAVNTGNWMGKNS